jgi:phosphatidylinositol-3-phosphatase
VTGPGVLVAVAALGGVCALALAPGEHRPTVQAREGLHATATDAFVRSDGTAVALNGLNVVPVWSNSPGKTWSKARYASMAAKGFNSVRFVLYWDDFEPSRGRFDQTSLATLDTAVSRAKAAGLFVVLDMIHLWGPHGLEDVPKWAQSGDSVDSVQANAGAYLRMLARRYRHEPAVAAYDPVNEPRRSPIDQNAVLRMYDGLIATIREVDRDKVVLVEPTYGDTSIQGACADLSNLTHRANVAFSIHDYFAGGDDDGFGVGCRQTGVYAWNAHAGYATRDRGSLRAHLRAYLDKLRPARIPLYVGEFGMADGAVNRDQWVRDTLGLFDELGLGRAWWEYWTTAGHGAFSATSSSGRWRPITGLLVSSRRRVKAPPRTPPASGAPCGKAAKAPARWDHVVWIVLENKRYSQIIGAANAPYINMLAKRCGSASKFFAEAHPSLPNYIAMTSGSTQRIADDSGPSSHPLSAASIFSQLGSDWKALQESMPANCSRSNSGRYAVRHNPAVYYTNLRTSCENQDVPLRSAPDLSARFTFIAPDLCNDMHSSACAPNAEQQVQRGDRWLAGFLPKILGSAQYKADRTAVFITWDEDDYSSTQHVATLVLAPSVPPGTAATTTFNHYSLLRTTEEMLGLPSIGKATSAASMLRSFNLR